MLALYILLALAASLLALAALVLLVAWWIIVRMPGQSHRGSVPPLNEQETEICRALQRDLTILADDIGERNVSHRYSSLVEAAEFLELSLKEMGYQVAQEELTADGKTVWNVVAERKGNASNEVVVIGAHYDTVPGSPGANDNGSAVVATLALARIFVAVPTGRTLRFVFFVNEESPYYMTEAMGSLHHAQQCRQNGQKVSAMISLETIGSYSQEPLTQRYPVSLLGLIYPRTANFVAFVGNIASRQVVRTAVRGFRRTPFPSEGLAAPHALKDIFRSDHAAFWSCGYAALMVTDTANFRYPHYHTAEDTVDKIDFESLARIVTGLEGSIRELLE